MTIDELFLFLLDDLEERSQLGKGEYDALGMARLLRQLLLDGTSVATAVNRVETRRHRLRFRVTDTIPSPGILGWGLTDAFDPDYADPGEPTIELALDEFLARTILVVYGERASVADLIRFLAHNHGAVHTGRAGTPVEEGLRDLAWGASITVAKGTYSEPVYALAAIARVVLAGLADLRGQVESEIDWHAKPLKLRGFGRHTDPTRRGLHPDEK